MTESLQKQFANESAYRIRFDVLNMAQQLLVDEYHTKHNRASHLENQHIKLDFPDYPTSDEIVTKAKELYSFVTTK